MKRMILWVAAMVCAATPILAQTSETFTVEGIVRDSISGDAEPYSTIRVMQQGKEKPFKVTTSDTEGRFSLKLPRKGKYTLECVVIGKAVLRREVEADERSTVALDDLLLQDITHSLATATVTAQRPLVKAEIDKLTYSMADDPEAQTHTLLEMLRKVPMVTVDGEDEIKVKGSAGFKVYVNGKPNQMMSSNPSLIFKNYPASTVKKIEVVTDPGSKYDAEGVSGILNIITNETTSTKGYSITPNLGWSNRGVRGGLFGLVQMGRLTLSVNYMAGHNNDPNSTNTSERETFNDPLNHLYQSKGETVKKSGTFQFGNLEASYEFNEHNLLSITGGIHAYEGKNRFVGANGMWREDGTLLYAYDRNAYSKVKYPSYNFGADYQHTFPTEGRMLTFSYRLETSPTRVRSLSCYTFNPDEAPAFSLTDLSTDSKDRSAEHTGQVDFTTPLGKHHEWSIGAKYIYRNNQSDNVEMQREAGSDDEFLRDADKSLRYCHQTDIAAGYAEYQLKYDRLTARAGVRYEYSKVHATYPDGSQPGYTHHFNDWVPTVSVGFKPSEMQMLKLSYNMRIGRPSIGSLSPYVNHSNPTEVSYGNPNLDSEKQHNLGLDFSHFSVKGSVSVSLNYALSNNGLTSYRFVEDGVVNTTSDNIKHSKVASLNLFANLTAVRNLTLNLNANGSYADYKCPLTNDHNHGWIGGIGGGAQYQLPWKMKVGFWGGIWSRSIDLQTSMTGWKFYSFHISRNFLAEDRLSVSFRAGNFINPKRHLHNVVETETFRSVSENVVDMMRLGVNVRYRIGKLKTMVKKAQRSILNDDVVGGANGNGNAEMGGDGGN